MTGFVANIADTIGIGSFAVIVAFNRLWPIISIKNLAGTLNTHSIIPALVQCLAFLTLVKTDILTLITLLSGAIVGGFLGATVVSNFDKNKIKISMIFAYFLISVIVFCNQINILPIGGEAFFLTKTKLILGFFLMLLVGIFPAVGVGGYTPIQIILFFLGLNPLVAWPVMTTAGSIQQSMAAFKFLGFKQVALKESLYLAASGVIATFLIIPFIAKFNSKDLRWLLLLIILFNISTLIKDLKNSKFLNC